MKKKKMLSLHKISFCFLSLISSALLLISSPAEGQSLNHADSSSSTFHPHQGDLIPIPDHYLDETHSEDHSEEDYDYDLYQDEHFHDFHNTNQDSSTESSASSFSPRIDAGDLNRKPIFLQEPTDTFVLKNKPAVVTCRAALAFSVHFECNGETEKPTTTQTHVDPETAVRYFNVSLEVKREAVDEFFGDYNCACVASSGNGVSKTRYALIAHAYLKKQFEVPPYSQTVAAGKQVQMRCIPPKGRPSPRTFWTHNGRVIDVDGADSGSYLISGEGHLIVISARPEDAGNYSCVAQNVANKRVSSTATLNVHVGGQWSSWSDWGPCLPTGGTLDPCGSPGVQKRSRSCQTLGGGGGGSNLAPNCPLGNSVQTQKCRPDCRPHAKIVGGSGGWSQWSDWSECTPECYQNRRRTCTNPKPRNGGKYCQGLNLERRNCTGGFCKDSVLMISSDAAGGSGSSSSADKRNETSNGGSDATAIALYIILGVALSLITIAIVMVARALFRRRKTCHSPGRLENGGGGGAGHQNGYTMTSTDYGYSSEESKKLNGSNGYHNAGGESASLVPQSASNGSLLNRASAVQTPATVCYEYSYPDSNSNHSHNSKQGFLRPISEHHYEQPMVVFPGGQPQGMRTVLSTSASVHPPTSHSPADSFGKPARSESNTSTTTSGSGGQNQPETKTHSSPIPGSGSYGFFPITSTPLPSSSSTVSTSASTTLMPAMDPKFTAWGTVTSAGARLVVPDSNVFLTIPPGAVAQSHPVDVFVSVIHPAQGPISATAASGAKRETLLSPVVVCGPRDASARLKKPVIVSMPHCASLRHGNWSVSLMQNDYSSGASGYANAAEMNGNPSSTTTTWHKSVTLGQETIDTPAYVQMDLNVAHIMCDRLTAFALVGESTSNANGPAVKSLRLAAFTQEINNPSSPPSEVTVRIYCLPDTDDALSFVAESEKRYNGRLLDVPVSVLYGDTGRNLCLKIESVTQNWSTLQPGADYLEVPFYHLWSASNPTMHCSFTFRAACNPTTGLPKASKFGFQVGISQASNNEQQKQTLMKVICDLTAEGASQSLRGPPGPLPLPPQEPLTSCKFRLSPQSMSGLSKLLDPPNQSGCDWRLLAERLSVHRYINYFATRVSPTEAILQLWEARNRELLAVSNLVNVMRGMGRFDAADLLERSE